MEYCLLCGLFYLLYLGGLMLEAILKASILLWGYGMLYLLSKFFNKPYGALIILTVFGIILYAKEFAVGIF